MLVFSHPAGFLEKTVSNQLLSAHQQSLKRPQPPGTHRRIIKILRPSRQIHKRPARLAVFPKGNSIQIRRNL
jgi:hypothetical protein